MSYSPDQLIKIASNYADTAVLSLNKLTKTQSKTSSIIETGNTFSKKYAQIPGWMGGGLGVPSSSTLPNGDGNPSAPGYQGGTGTREVPSNGEGNPSAPGYQGGTGTRQHQAVTTKAGYSAKAVQQQLLARKAYLGPTGADGDWGHQSEAAFQKWKKDSGLQMITDNEAIKRLMSGATVPTTTTTSQQVNPEAMRTSIAQVNNYITSLRTKLSQDPNMGNQNISEIFQQLQTLSNGLYPAMTAAQISTDPATQELAMQAKNTFDELAGYVRYVGNKINQSRINRQSI